MIVGVLASCYATALALRVVINLAYKYLVEPTWQFKTLFEVLEGSLSTTYLLLCWSALYFGIKYYESLAAAARSGAQGDRARTGGAAEDVALSAESAFSVQHAECDLNAHPRQPESHCQPRRCAFVGVFALYARSGSDEKGHAAQGDGSRSTCISTRSGCASASGCGSNMRSKRARSTPCCRACCCSRSLKMR